MNTIMNELEEFKNSKMGMYDSATGKTVYAKKVIDLITKRDLKGQVVIKYATVKRGVIAQICQWYEKGKDLGMTLHYHINEMTAESLAADSVFETHASTIGYKPIDLARIIYENAPDETPVAAPVSENWEKEIEQCRLYAESKMSENWDRKDEIQIGIFYKHYIDKMTELLAPAAPVNEGVEKLIEKLKRKRQNLIEVKGEILNAVYTELLNQYDNIIKDLERCKQ